MQQCMRHCLQTWISQGWMACLQAALLLQQEVVGDPLARTHDSAWSWTAAGEHEAPMSTWS